VLYCMARDLGCLCATKCKKYTLKEFQNVGEVEHFTEREFMIIS